MSAASRREIVTGHDFRSYSSAIKMALVTGLMAAGCKVHDIGLALSPMAYFAQFALDVPLRRHGHRLPQRQWLDRREDGHRAARHLRAGGDGRLKEIVLSGEYRTSAGGSYVFVPELPAVYFMADLLDRPKIPAQAQGRRGLRQRHGGRLRPADAGGAGLRGRAPRLPSSTTPSRATIPTPKT
jgi:hypothetical protein